MRGFRFRGFTLIELLVVIAIIAILAAILFPVFARARDRAQTTACLSNMKQIGVGLYTYLQDYDDTYPFLRNVNAPGYTWREQLFPYVKSKDVSACPSNPYAKRFPKLTAEGGTQPISYALNGSMFGNYDKAVIAHKLSAIKAPSNSIFVAESRHDSAEVGVWLVNLEYDQAYKGGPAHGQGYFFHHGGRMNFVMCDTSARSLKLMQTLEPSDMWHDPRVSQSAIDSAYAPQMFAEYR
ncbi:MAG TPA: prepilin-type N-terminal cleavage/methylation domain-containing protein [Armatimonadota bacterium]|jgi:prepilin-type N-terminal cleavage/methylation domain-containing protein/prepilin-type processing-associated H-X9-DG protein